MEKKKTDHIMNQKGYDLMFEDRKELVEKVIESIKSGAPLWRKPWDSDEIAKIMQINPVSNISYSGINFIRLFLESKNKGYKDNRWATFKQAQENGWHIKSGEHGTPIYKWTEYDKITDEYPNWKEIGTLTEAEQKKYIEKNIQKGFCFSGKVFNAEQIEGIPKIKTTWTAQELESMKNERNEDIEKIISNSPAKIFYDMQEAYYVPSKDTIHLPSREKFISIDSFYGTALHEMAHSTGNANRLNRLSDSSDPQAYAREELVAELTSMFINAKLGTAIGGTVFENNVAYLGSWVKALENDYSIFYDASKDAEKASDFLIALKEKEQKESKTDNDSSFRGKANSNEQIESGEVEEQKQYLSPQQYFAQKNLKRIEQIEANTPQEMKDLPNWCVYKTMYDRETGKTAKKILKASDGTWAKSNDPTTWSTFEQALQYARENNCAGLAFALNKKGITCIDIDHCINEQNYRSELCWDILNRSQGTYAEKSVSNRGVHIFFKADMVDGYRIKNDDIGLECYDSTRFISMTGNLIKNHKNELVEASDKLVTYVHEKMGKMQERKNDIEQRQGVSFLSDREVIEKIERSQVGSLFQRMWSGEKIVNNDHSATDLKLMNMLAFFTDCDRNQMLSIFSQSGLMRNEKPNKYYERTADKAISTLPQRADHLTASQKSKSKAQSQNKKTSQSNEQQSIKS